MQKHY